MYVFVLRVYSVSNGLCVLLPLAGDAHPELRDVLYMYRYGYTSR